MFSLFAFKDEMKPFVLIDSFVFCTPVRDAVNYRSNLSKPHISKDNEKVSVKKLSNCQPSGTPLLKAVDKKQKKKVWFFLNVFFVFVVCVTARGTWQKSPSWSTRRSWCIVGSWIWRGGRTPTARWRTWSLGIRWPSWAGTSCWPTLVPDWPSWTTPRYPVCINEKHNSSRLQWLYTADFPQIMNLKVHYATFLRVVNKQKKRSSWYRNSSLQQLTWLLDVL